MSESNQIVTVDVPVTFHVSVACSGGSPADVAEAARNLAQVAAEHLAHVGASKISAFNEVNRLHHPGQGRVDAVSVSIRPVGQPA